MHRSSHRIPKTVAILAQVAVDHLVFCLAVEIKCWRFDFNRRTTLRVVRCQVVEPDTGTTTDAWKLIEEDELAAG